MKCVCAWCGRALGQPELPEVLRVTHGVCQDCRSRFFASSKATKTGTSEDVGDTPQAPDRCPGNDVSKGVSPGHRTPRASGKGDVMQLMKNAFPLARVIERSGR